ncbi:hypothetical protein WJX82_004872 [Trebouxia sp. C0006]
MRASQETLRRFLSPQEYTALMRNGSTLPDLDKAGTWFRHLDAKTDAKSECAFLKDLNKQDPQITALVTVVLAEVQSCRAKRRRDEPATACEDAWFPSKNSHGTEINSGVCGDHSFAPQQDPCTCTRSGTFHMAVTETMRFEWEFTIHKVAAVEHTVHAPNIATVECIDETSEAKGQLLVSTIEPHNFKGKVTYGHFVSPSNADMQGLLQTGMRVAKGNSNAKETHIPNWQKPVFHIVMTKFPLSSCQGLNQTDSAVTAPNSQL